MNVSPDTCVVVIDVPVRKITGNKVFYIILNWTTALSLSSLLTKTGLGTDAKIWVL